MVDKHARVRTRDTSICAAVSGDNAIATFTEFDDPFVSSLNPAHVAEWAKSRRIIRERAVQTRTLTEILKANSVPQSFEVLSVDVEGHDFEVLSSLDLSTYRPRLIVIEMHGFDVLTAEENAIYRLLSRAGYALVSFVVMNGYFIDTRAVNGSGK
jgi:FkbM family methyltransferase